MTEIEERLAKCPFCGHRDMKMIDAIKGIDAHYLIVCEYCGAMTSFDYTSTRVECMKAWNRRTK
ncbi:Lar family restriction alleviation protein [uncultured Veillonella sp.]|uniref:Lar family restriction alleviation protein n=1 Tax=uncultured Veillonella sp. TaxID=159268 RepID=UPI002598CDBE|nr:Lar family restriction alleviation protein [uncultured Veillonella sp.]